MGNKRKKQAQGNTIAWVVIVVLIVFLIVLAKIL